MDKQINKVKKFEKISKKSLDKGIKATDKLLKMDKKQDKKLDTLVSLKKGRK